MNMVETQNEIAERLAIRIHDALADSREANADVVGRLGAILYGLDDDDVKALRGTSSHAIDSSEIPYLIEMGLKSVNDPRILSVTADGGSDSEVMIEVVGGTTYIIRDRNIDVEDSESDADSSPFLAAEMNTPGSSTLIREILTDVSDYAARSLKMAFLAGKDAPVPFALEGGVVLVSENEGGIFAYGLDEDTANAIVRKLNQGCPIDDPDFYALDFDRMDHGTDYVKSVGKGDLMRLMNGEKPIGYVLHGARATQKLLTVVLD